MGPRLTPAPALRRVVDPATTLSHWCSLAVLVGLVVAVNADVLGRLALNRPVPGTAELMGQAVVIAVFLQLPNAFRRQRFLRTDSLMLVLRRRSPRCARALHFLLHGLAIAILLPLLLYSLPMLSKDLSSGDYVGAVGNVTFPVWPARLAVIIGSGLLLLQLGLRGTDPQPGGESSGPVSL